MGAPHERGFAGGQSRKSSDGRHQHALRGKRPDDLSPSVTRVRFFTGVHQPECRQYPDIASYGRPVSLENSCQFRNRRRIPSYRVENTNPLRREHSKQIGGIFERQAHLRKQPLAAIHLLRASRRPLEKSAAHSLGTSHPLVHLPASHSSRLQFGAAPGPLQDYRIVDDFFLRTPPGNLRHSSV
jgi:hypothetical protein